MHSLCAREWLSCGPGVVLPCLFTSRRPSGLDAVGRLVWGVLLWRCALPQALRVSRCLPPDSRFLRVRRSGRCPLRGVPASHSGGSCVVARDAV